MTIIETFIFLDTRIRVFIYTLLKLFIVLKFFTFENLFGIFTFLFIDLWSFCLKVKIGTPLEPFLTFHTRLQVQVVIKLVCPNQLFFSEEFVLTK